MKSFITSGLGTPSEAELCQFLFPFSIKSPPGRKDFLFEKQTPFERIVLPKGANRTSQKLFPLTNVAKSVAQRGFLI